MFVQTLTGMADMGTKRRGGSATKALELLDDALKVSSKTE